MSGKETNQKQESQDHKIDDLPVSHSELDMVMGGSVTPLPVLHVIANGDFYYR
jgi:hypothetical protein